MKLLCEGLATYKDAAGGLEGNKAGKPDGTGTPWTASDLQSGALCEAVKYRVPLAKVPGSQDPFPSELKNICQYGAPKVRD